MNLPKLFLSTVLLATTVSVAQSKPAMKGYRNFTQPDGTVLKIRLVGDEHLHFTVSEEGYLLKLDEDGYYRLGALNSEGVILSSGLEPTDPKAASIAVRLDDVDMSKLRAARISKRKAPQSGMGMSRASYPTTGNPKALIILVEYTDVKFKSQDGYNGKDYFNDMINGDNFTQSGGTGSAKQYFKDQSGGKFMPEFDVLGPVTLPNKRSFYGKNDRWGDDENAHLMVTHAIDILDAEIDFSKYDTDKDGIIDSVYVFYAGQGEADFGSEDTVWPHAWDVRNAGIEKRVDGVLIAKYACSNEWNDKIPSGVGNFVHEFSHVMGLPDLYHTQDGDVRYTPDEYSVLDYGPYNNDGRTPPNYSAYEKNALGWFEPIMLNSPLTVTLHEITTGEFGLIPTEKDTEFFLLENRQQNGWDKYIPNHGMLIWHIDYVKTKFENSEVNNTEKHQYVDIVEANNKQDYYYSKGYTWPGTSGKTSFTSSTIPALKSWSGMDIDLPITDITEKEGLISFNVKGGSIEDAGISDALLMEDDNPVYFNLQGIRIENPAKGEIVIMKKGDKITKIIK